MWFEDGTIARSLGLHAEFPDEHTHECLHLDSARRDVGMLQARVWVIWDVKVRLVERLFAWMPVKRNEFSLGLGVLHNCVGVSPGAHVPGSFSAVRENLERPVHINEIGRAALCGGDANGFVARENQVVTFTVSRIVAIGRKVSCRVNTRDRLPDPLNVVGERFPRSASSHASARRLRFRDSNREHPADRE